MYDYLFTEIGDPRIKSWSFMQDPLSALIILMLYLFVIYVYLPSYMQTRKPYDLKILLAVYNIFQVISCVLLVRGMLTTGTVIITLQCQEVDFTENENTMAMANYFWWTFILKMIELIETIFFILRKKFNQVSSLHVFHHVTTYCVAWMTCKYGPGGMFAFVIVINSLVHILMYTYYFFAALGTNIQNKLKPIKKILTIIQTVQLIMITTYMLQTVIPRCNIPRAVPIIFLPIMLTNILFFIQFYKKAYIKKDKRN